MFFPETGSPSADIRSSTVKKECHPGPNPKTVICRTQTVMDLREVFVFGGGVAGAQRLDEARSTKNGGGGARKKNERGKKLWNS